MTNTYLENITPDSFSGLLFGFEGMKNTIVLMNGPTGCKFYHSATSDNQTLRQMEFDPLNFPELLYFGQPRIPCTYLDKRDYVYGSRDKITEAVQFLEKQLSFDLLVIVNSPGAALIGDDLKGILTEVMTTATPVITVESPGYSKHIWDGYSISCKELLQNFCCNSSQTVTNRGKKSVNLLGFSIFHKYYQGDIAELTRLLGFCGIEVNCTLCCESTVNEIRRMPDAALNIVLDSAYGLDSAQWLQEKYNMPYICCDDGLPVGFRATESFIKKICEALEIEKAKADTFAVESEKSRARSYIYLSRINSLTGLPKGAKFAVQGTAAQCLAYSKFLIQYFGMIADSICLLDENENDDAITLTRFLKSCGMIHALEKDILSTNAELVFADGNIIAKLKARNLVFSGIEIGLPSLGYVDVIPKTHLGLSGSLLLCEQVINGLMF